MFRINIKGRKRAATDPDLPIATDAEWVRRGYQLFFDREPEDPSVIASQVATCPDLPSLRKRLLTSREFARKNPSLISSALDGREPPMRIERVDDPRDLATILDHIARVWKFYGDTEPHWSVLTDDRFASNRIESTKDDFFASGKEPALTLARTLERNGLAPSAFRTCLEYGCGLGRITRWLADSFDHIYAYDISASHLDGAERHLAHVGVQNVTLKRIGCVEDIHGLERVDLIYSVIVLQHNPPPVIRLIVNAFLRALNPGGVAYFQVPTYRQGYVFSQERYLDDEATRHEMMEMHVLPQAEIFESVAAEGCRVLQVFEDGLTGFRPKEVSNTFLIQKPG
jgi:2-polyprenyl-3-methyl-5-hydroxy-6-metoxy-1,4-benzoquinol methylase